MDKELDEIIHREELKHYLNEDELTLPDDQREELLIQRKLVDQGLLSEMDLSANRDVIRQAAKKSAASRNKLSFWAWMDNLPDWLKIVLFLGASLIISMIVHSLDERFFK